MSDIAIRVENLSKQYKLGATIRHDSLKDLLSSGLNGIFSPRASHSSLDARRSTVPNPLSEIPHSKSDFIWALKDVSFEVKQGEKLGIIGHNGAGKTTLLKILSRITEPTSGRAEIFGRVGSLLEVGTGFDRELTGRENIYLNGAILGMTKREIEKKFDEIVDFSGVEQFIDTPVKRYSSGMYVRLAFAVAAHLEPEMLIVDEVLAVGDAAFQKKCLGKMEGVAKEGRTVLFVSHNMAALTSLCTKAILLDSGKITDTGLASTVAQTYLESVANGTSRGESTLETSSNLPFLINSVSTSNEKSHVTSVLRRRESVVVILKGEVRELGRDYHAAIDVKAVDGTLLFRTHSFEHSGSFETLTRRGAFTLKCTLPSRLLPAGTYKLGIITAITGKRELQNLYPALEFEIVQDDLVGGIFVGTRGMLTPHCHWTISPDLDAD